MVVFFPFLPFLFLGFVSIVALLGIYVAPQPPPYVGTVHLQAWLRRHAAPTAGATRQVRRGQYETYHQGRWVPTTVQARTTRTGVEVQVGGIWVPEKEAFRSGYYKTGAGEYKFGTGKAKIQLQQREFREKIETGPGALLRRRLPTRQVGVTTVEPELKELLRQQRMREVLTPTQLRSQQEKITSLLYPVPTTKIVERRRLPEVIEKSLEVYRKRSERIEWEYTGMTYPELLTEAEKKRMREKAYVGFGILPSLKKEPGEIARLSEKRYREITVRSQLKAGNLMKESEGLNKEIAEFNKKMAASPPETEAEYNLMRKEYDKLLKKQGKVTKELGEIQKTYGAIQIAGRPEPTIEFIAEEKKMVKVIPVAVEAVLKATYPKPLLEAKIPLVGATYPEIVSAEILERQRQIRMYPTRTAATIGAFGILGMGLGPGVPALPKIVKPVAEFLGKVPIVKKIAPALLPAAIAGTYGVSLYERAAKVPPGLERARVLARARITELEPMILGGYFGYKVGKVSTRISEDVLFKRPKPEVPKVKVYTKKELEYLQQFYKKRPSIPKARKLALERYAEQFEQARLLEKARVLRTGKIPRKVPPRFTREEIWPRKVQKLPKGKVKGIYELGRDIYAKRKPTVTLKMVKEPKVSIKKAKSILEDLQKTYGMRREIKGRIIELKPKPRVYTKEELEWLKGIYRKKVKVTYKIVPREPIAKPRLEVLKRFEEWKVGRLSKLDRAFIKGQFEARARGAVDIIKLPKGRQLPRPEVLQYLKPKVSPKPPIEVIKIKTGMPPGVPRKPIPSALKGLKRLYEPGKIRIRDITTGKQITVKVKPKVPEPIQLKALERFRAKPTVPVTKIAKPPRTIITMKDIFKPTKVPRGVKPIRVGRQVLLQRAVLKPQVLKPELKVKVKPIELQPEKLRQIQWVKPVVSPIQRFRARYFPAVIALPKLAKKERQRIIAIPRPIEVAALRQPQVLRLRQAQFAGLAQPQAIGLRQPLIELEAPALAQAQIQRLRLFELQMPKLKAPTILVPPPPKIKRKIEEAPRRISKRLVKAYRVFAKRRGKWLPISRPITKGEAIRKGEKYVRATLAASFKIRPRGMIPVIKRPYEPSPRIFRQYKIRRGRKIPLEETWIQRAKYRLAAPSEVYEIQKARRIAERRFKNKRRKWL